MIDSSWARSESTVRTTGAFWSYRKWDGSNIIASLLLLFYPTIEFLSFSFTCSLKLHRSCSFLKNAYPSINVIPGEQAKRRTGPVGDCVHLCVSPNGR